MSWIGTTPEKFGVKVTTLARAVFVDTVMEAKKSIQFGSPLTGAPGQPVQSGELRDSWKEDFGDASHATISTDVSWAPSNEDGIARPGGGAYIQRSAVGGRHSVALTVAGGQRILDSVAERLK